jgi:hypothetical protein
MEIKDRRVKDGEATEINEMRMADQLDDCRVTKNN